MQISQVMTSYTQLILIIYEDISASCVSETFDSLQYVSTRCAQQYELNSFVTMATLDFRPPQY